MTLAIKPLPPKRLIFENNNLEREERAHLAKVNFAKLFEREIGFLATAFILRNAPLENIARLY